MAWDYKALTRRWFDEVWNTKRRDAIAELLAPDGVGHGLGGGKVVGPGEFGSFHDQFVGAFPDFRVVVEEVIAEGETTVARFRCEGTHHGPQLGIQPTGKGVAFHGMSWIRWRDGKIAEAWNEYDAAGMMQQLS